jgi:stage IV sporulation protein FB
MELDPLFLLLLPIIIICGDITEFFIIYLSIIFHELGHIYTAKMLGKKIYGIRLLAVGLNAYIDEDNCDSLDRILIFISGPLINIFFIAMSLLLKTYFKIEHEYMLFFISVNICLAIFNLLPVLPLDGGKILRELLARRIGLFMTSRYIKRLSIIVVIFLTPLGIIQFIGNNYNFSILAIGVYIFSTLKTEGMEAALMNAKYVVYRRSKLLKRGIYQARDLVVLKSTRLSDVLNCMDFDRFHILHVLDDDLKLLKILTEHEVMEYMLKNNSEITFQEFIENIQK